MHFKCIFSNVHEESSIKKTLFTHADFSFFKLNKLFSMLPKEKALTLPPANKNTNQQGFN